MQIDEFIKNLIEDRSEYSLTPEDAKKIQHEGIGKFIFDKLNSSKFKASATEEKYLAKIKEKIDTSIAEDAPIHITLPFGATKNPYLPTAPHIDWAEVFSIAYLRQYLKPLAKAYKHGVILEYVSVAVFEEKVNRIPKADADLYDTEFLALLEIYKKFLPENFRILYTRVEDVISRDKINNALTIKIEELEKVWDKQSPEIIAYKLVRAKRNSLFDEKDPHKDELILESALGHDAFCSECWTTEAAPWDKKDMIVLGHNYTSGWAIHVRSAAGSSVNFWSGIGVLVAKGDKYIPTVLSPKQYEEVKDRVKESPIDIFQGKFKNLDTIAVV